jgi:hypothetical protein
MEGVYICILLLLAAARMVGVGEFEQLDGRGVCDYERDADAVGWSVGRNQDFAANKLGGEISHFKRDLRNSQRDSAVLSNDELVRPAQYRSAPLLVSVLASDGLQPNELIASVVSLPRLRMTQEMFQQADSQRGSQDYSP